MKKIIMFICAALAASTIMFSIPSNDINTQASSKTIARSWRGTYYGDKKLTITAHTIKYGSYKAKVKYFKKASSGYYHFYFYGQHSLWLKHKGGRIAMRLLPNDYPTIFY